MRTTCVYEDGLNTEGFCGVACFYCTFEMKEHFCKKYKAKDDVIRTIENEKCKNCKHLGEIYFPPTDCQDAIRLKACFSYADEKTVMYLDTVQSMCESFEEK